MNSFPSSDDKLFRLAIESLAQSRQLFEECAKRGLILGNDNHIGDIGEYWVLKWYRLQGHQADLAKDKTSDFDISVLDTKDLISVKTITAWSAHGKGTQIKPLNENGNPWNVLAVVILSTDLTPSQISIISLHDLLKTPEFIENGIKRREKGTKTYPCVSRDWKWLEAYSVDLSKLVGAEER